MTIPQHLAPTVGPAHGGFEFLKGNFEWLKGYVVGRMTKSRHSKLYINDEGWGPEASSIEYGYRVGESARESSSAESASQALRRTSTPTSLKRLSTRGPPVFNLS